MAKKQIKEVRMFQTTDGAKFNNEKDAKKYQMGINKRKKEEEKREKQKHTIITEIKRALERLYPELVKLAYKIEEGEDYDDDNEVAFYEKAFELLSPLADDFEIYDATEVMYCLAESIYNACDYTAHPDILIAFATGMKMAGVTR